MHLGKDISRWGLCDCGSSSIRSRYWEAVAGSFSSHRHVSLQIGWRRPIVVVDPETIIHNQNNVSLKEDILSI
jgi:hypothetical protein